MTLGPKGQYAARTGIPLDTLYSAPMRELLNPAMEVNSGRLSLNFEKADAILLATEYSGAKPKDRAAPVAATMEDDVTLGSLKQAVFEMDPEITEDSEEFMAAICFLAPAAVGVSCIRISEFTGYPLSFVNTLSRNWRQSGIWKGRRHAKVYLSDLDDEEGICAIAFWLHVLAGLGYIERVTE